MHPQQLRATLQLTFLAIGMPLLLLFGIACGCDSGRIRGTDTNGPLGAALHTQDIQASEGQVSRSQEIYPTTLDASAGEAQVLNQAVPGFFYGILIPTAPGSAQPGVIMPGAEAGYDMGSAPTMYPLTDTVAGGTTVLNTLFPPPSGSQWVALSLTDPHALDSLFSGPVYLPDARIYLNYTIDFGGADPCNGCEVKLTYCAPGQFAAFLPPGSIAVATDASGLPVSCTRPVATYVSIYPFNQPLPNAPTVAAFSLWGSTPAFATVTDQISLTVDLQHTGATSLDFDLGAIQSARGLTYHWADPQGNPITHISVGPYAPLPVTDPNLRVIGTGLPTCTQEIDVLQLVATNTVTPSLQATAEGYVQILPDPATCPVVDVAAFHAQEQALISDGDRITYTLTISNLMNTVQSGVLVQTISPTVAIRGADLPGNCALAGASVTCQVSDIPANGATNVPIVLLGKGGFSGALWSTEQVTPTGATDLNYLDNIHGPLTAAVNFISPTYSLTVTKSGTGSGSVTSVPSGIDCGLDCTETFAAGAVVTLTATADVGSIFVDWSGACAGAAAACPLTIASAATATANFAPIKTHTLTVTKTGSGSGNVTSSPAGIDCGLDCTETVVEGAVFTLTATANAGAIFTDWTGGCTGTSSTCLITMDGDKTVTATFASAPTFPLTVTKAGTGAGTVTSAPPGIDCGNTCTANFAAGATVTLTAAPANGSTFVNWTNGCTGANRVCQVTLNAAQSATATFATGLTNQLFLPSLKR